MHAVNPVSSSSAHAHQRYAYIDTLRGLAAAYVLFFHVRFIPDPFLPVSPLLLLGIRKGYTGVTLFFVLSAFTMMNSMRGRSGEPARDLKFYIRRVFRIVPLYYFWLALMLGRIFVLGGTVSSLWVFTSLTFIFNFIPGLQEGLVWASWTLGVEMIFYLAFPLIFRYVTNWQRAILFLFLSMGISLLFGQVASRLPLSEGQLNVFLQYSFFRKLPAFAFGILTFYIYEALIENRKVPVAWSYALVSFALVGFGLYALYFSDLIGSRFDEIYVLGLLFSCLVLGLAIRPWKLFVNRVTIFLGTLSYSIYLAHPVVIQYLRPIYTRIYTLPLRSSVNYVLSVLLTFLVVLLIAYITYRLIEKPGMDFGSQLVRRMKKAPVRQPELAPRGTD